MIQFPAGAQGVSHFQSIQTSTGDTQHTIQWIKTLAPRAISRGVKLTTHLHLTDKFKNELSYTSTIPNEFMASKETTLTFTYSDCNTYQTNKRNFINAYIKSTCKW
jgi:hypothetical protein